MNLRCKPWDLAMVIRAGGPATANLGVCVTCVRFVGIPPICRPGYTHGVADWWEVDRALVLADGSLLPYAPDRALMPIRPDELKEEERETEKAI